MNYRTTIVLLVIFAVLGGYVYWSGRNQSADTASESGTPTPTEVAVLRVNATDVSAVVVRDKAGKQVRAERNGNSWKLTAPQAEPADAAQVSALADGVAALSATRIITPTSQDLEPFGLAAPGYTVELLKGTTPLAELKLGAKNPDGSATYVQRGDSPTIYLSSDPILATATSWLTTPPIQPTPLPTLPLTMQPTAPASSSTTLPATPTPVAFPTLTPLLGAPPTATP